MDTPTLTVIFQVSWLTLTIHPLSNSESLQPHGINPIFESHITPSNHVFFLNPLCVTPSSHVLKIYCGTAADADLTLGGNVLPAVTYCWSHNSMIYRLLGIYLKLHLKPIREQRASGSHFHLATYIRLPVHAFIVYVRPIVEYNSVSWSPVAKHDTEVVEKVQ